MKVGRTLQEIAVELTRQKETKQDFKVPPRSVRMTDRATLVPVKGDGMPELPLTSWAHSQLASDLKIEKPYYDRMLAVQPKLLAENVNVWLANQPDYVYSQDQVPTKGRMLRVLDGKARAWVSDIYRPLDNFDLAMSALPIFKELNGVQIESTELTETRLYLKARLTRDMVGLTLDTAKKLVRHEGSASQILGMVVSLRNSEVGHGAVDIEYGLWVQSCTNVLLAGSVLKKYHVGGGRRSDGYDDGEITAMLTDDTRRLVDAAFWAKFGDVLRGSFQPARFDEMVNRVIDVSSRVIEGDVPAVVQTVAKRYRLNEHESNNVLKHLAEGGDLSQWGVVNAITRTSQDDAIEYERATELERIGGQVFRMPPTDWKKVANAVMPTTPVEETA